MPISSSLEPAPAHTQVSRDFIQNMPKVELHLHLGGSYPLSYLEEISTDHDRQCLHEYLCPKRDIISYHEWFRVFDVIERVVDSESKVEEGARRLCHDLAKDGVIYVEIRTGLKDYGQGYVAYIDAVQRGIERGIKETGIQARLILSFRRNTPFDLAKLTVEEAIARKDKGVVGIDVSGDSGIGNIEPLLPLLTKAKESGLGICIHMGECVEECDQKLILDHIIPHRIGHGVHLGDDAHKIVHENKLAVEACLTSSVIAQMIAKEEHHPAIEWWKNGHPVCFSTDDPLIFQVSLTDELWKLSQMENLDKKQLVELSYDALNYSFLSKEEKESLIHKIKNYYC
ncbi:MAG: hypothetical protein CMO81_11140 [Waddliaceae bacterium]|nr:hypothetical protein [Waddliaceae bacterium]